MFLHETEKDPKLGFDWMGFATLSLAFGVLADDAGSRRAIGLVFIKPR